MNRALRISLLPFAAGLLSGCEPVRLSSELVFRNGWALWALIPAIALTIWGFFQERPAALAYTRTAVLDRGVQSWRYYIRPLPWILRLVAVIALAIACARPQSEEREEETVEGMDIMLVLDMSGSMAAVDMSQQEVLSYQRAEQAEPPNRFQNAVATLKSVVDGRSRDRIGMVVFARDAYLQFPLTLDYRTIQGLLDRLELNAIDASATAIGNALGIGVRGLLDSDAESRAIILITDGKQQGGNISPNQAAQIAAEEGIRIYPILVGRDGPTLVPTNRRRPGVGLIYDSQRYPVDPELLAEIAETTDGAFYRSEAPEELEEDLNEILDQLETTTLSAVSNVRRKEEFPPFLILAIACLGIEAFLRYLVIRRLP